MNNVQKFALLYLLLLAVFVYGYAAARFGLFPHDLVEPHLAEVEAFAAGAAQEKDSSIIEKIKNDAGISPERFTYPVPEAFFESHASLEVPGLKGRRDQPAVFMDTSRPSGYRFIAGAMDFEETFWGALLLDPQGKVVNTWRLSTEHLPKNKAPDLLKVLYGMHLGRDGSVTFTMQEPGGGIVKVDACSKEVWNMPGRFHHTVATNGDGTFWTFVGSQYTLDQNLVQFSQETGKRIRRIAMPEVRKANKHLHVWDLTKPAFGDPGTTRFINGNLTHGNDIDPLGEDVAAAFPDFEVGDLLISYATTNLVFVLDPDTLEVKWWRVGLTDYQHDPDWESDGRIVIYSNENRAEENYSRIVYVDPVTFEDGAVFEGETNQFRSPANGMHQRTAYGTRVIVSSNQGWVFEVDDAGETVFSFLNTYSQEDHETMHLGEALHLPPDYFEGKPWEACGTQDG